MTSFLYLKLNYTLKYITVKECGAEQDFFFFQKSSMNIEIILV